MCLCCRHCHDNDDGGREGGGGVLYLASSMNVSLLSALSLAEERFTARTPTAFRASTCETTNDNRQQTTYISESDRLLQIYRSIGRQTDNMIKGTASTPPVLTWSCMSDMRGEKTTARPAVHQAGNWYTTDLPPPVGIRQKTSRPKSAASTHCLWPSLNPLWPNIRFISKW